MADLAPYPGTARWVKASGIVAVLLTLFVLFVVLGGGGPHGPGREVSAHRPNDHCIALADGRNRQRRGCGGELGSLRCRSSRAETIDKDARCGWHCGVAHSRDAVDI